MATGMPAKSTAMGPLRPVNSKDIWSGPEEAGMAPADWGRAGGTGLPPGTGAVAGWPGLRSALGLHMLGRLCSSCGTVSTGLGVGECVRVVCRWIDGRVKVEECANG